ncbi:MAG: hypothetical protein R6V67_07615 [Spirochaetia bacterium]
MPALKKSALSLGTLLLFFSLFFLVDVSPAHAEESDFDELSTLNCRVEGTMEGEPAEFWYRLHNIGTDDEAFRLDATNLESEKSMGIIIDQAHDRSFYKEMGSESWQQVPSAMLKQFWNIYREEHITAIGGADKWNEWAEADKDEYLAEVEVEGEKQEVRVYDIEVDEPIEDSVFSP